MPRATLQASLLWHHELVAILCYHSVDAAWEEPIAVSPEAFERDCRWLNRSRRVVSTSELAAALMRGKRARREVAVTFDDGFADFYDQALPTLRRYNVRATLFVVAKTLQDGEGGATWLRPRVEVPPRTLSLEQVREAVEQGVEIGSHSWAHHDLRTLSEEECRRDLSRSKEMLEDLLGRPVPLLAYPYGFHAPHVRRAAEAAGYDAAFSLPERREPTGRFAIPRAGIYRGNSLTTVRMKSTSWFMTGRVAYGYFATRRPGLPDDVTSSS